MSDRVVARPTRPDIAEKIETSRRAALPCYCPRCGAAIFVGPDHDNVAMTATVDAEPLDAAGEMFAILARRLTFDLLPLPAKGPGAVALYARERHNYTSEHTSRGTVHAQHDCKGRQSDPHTLF